MLTLALLKEMVAITETPTREGCNRLLSLRDCRDQRVSTVALSACLAISSGEKIKAESFMLLLDLDSLN